MPLKLPRCPPDVGEDAAPSPVLKEESIVRVTSFCIWKGKGSKMSWASWGYLGGAQRKELDPGPLKNPEDKVQRKASIY